MKLIATNQSYWSWEYDINSKTAMVYVDERTGDLSYEIVEEHTKTGLGAGTRRTILENGFMGTVRNPKVSKLIGLMRKHGHERSRSGGPFKKMWVDTDTKREDTLMNIIGRHASSSVLDDAEKKRKVLRRSLDRLSPDQLDAALKALGFTASVKNASKRIAGADVMKSRTGSIKDVMDIVRAFTLTYVRQPVSQIIMKIKRDPELAHEISRWRIRDRDIVRQIEETKYVFLPRRAAAELIRIAKDLMVD